MPYFRPPPFDKTSCSAAVAGCTPVVYQPGELKVVVCKNGKERDLAKDDPTVRTKSWQPINGDPTSFERFPAPERNAFNGQALVVVRTLAGRPGTIRVSAQSGTLQGAAVTLQSLAATR